MGTQRRHPEKAVAQAMRLAANETLPDGQKKIRKICAELVNKALEGDVQAANIVFDRLDGKPAQQQIISGDAEAPLQVVSNKPLSAEDWAIQYGTAANQD